MSSPTGEELKGAAAKQVVVEGLRRAILTGDMSPGQRLVEMDLAQMFSATRGSVRSAMDDLIAEGLLERIPNRGARVRVVSLEEAVALLECRSVLEGLIAVKAAERVSPEEAAKLEQIGRDMEAAVREGELLTYSRLNAELHSLIADVSGQRTAADLIVRLKAQIVRHQFQLSLRPGRAQVSLPQHLALIAGITTGDTAKAEAAARAHVNSVIDALQSGGPGS